MMSKKTLLLMAVLSLLATGVPHASSSFGIGPSYWDTEDADKSAGIGLQFAFQMNPLLDIEARASYFRELDDQPLDEIFDGDSPFETGLRALPVELGLRFNFARDAKVFHPYASVGGSYYFLDSEFGELDDEFGWYAGLGSSFGDGRGLDFFGEVLYRRAKGTVDISEVGDDAFEDRLPLDLTGFGINIGVRWNW